MKDFFSDPELIEEDETIQELEEISDFEDEELLPHSRKYYWSLFADQIETVPKIDLLAEPVRSWIDIHTSSPIPLCLCDIDLSVLWSNQAYDNAFDSAVRSDYNCLPEIFKFHNKQHTTWVIKSRLENSENAFSWHGQVFLKQDESETDSFIKLFIQPLLFDRGLPALFSCTWDIITKEFKDILQNTFRSLLEASKLKDNDTGNHISRVNEYCRALSEYLYKNPDFPEISPSFIDDIGMLAAMHDVGKIGTPDDILNKEGPLESWERTIMNEHTKNGAYILSTYPNSMAREIALCHHEKWDGSGYPYGIFENMIPLAARIVAIADVYDALRSERSYKESFSHEKSKEIILSGRGTHFDPKLVDSFIEIEETFKSIFNRSEDT